MTDCIVPSPLRICTTSKEAATAIAHHSFAILRLDSTTAASLDRAGRAARAFFSSTQQSRPEVDTQKYRMIADGDLFGYNVPSAAKVLFRAICSDEIMGGSSSSSQKQPWPDDMDGGELRCASVDVASRLHTLLVGCVDEVTLIAKECMGIGSSSSGKSEGRMRQAQRKRKRVSSSATTCNAIPGNKTKENAQDGTKKDTAIGSIRVPRTLEEAKYCPLDYFLYHGKSIVNDKPVINCSEHIDRGVLICVSLTGVPGLEVLCRSTQQFLCPETLSKSTLRESGFSDLVCVMAGDQLRKVANVAMDTDSLNDKGDKSDTFSACVHRVKDKLEHVRLSITYELRGT